jgi:hypothetical protein
VVDRYTVTNDVMDPDVAAPVPSGSARRTPRRGRARRLVVLVLASVLVLGLAACTPDQGEAYDLINATRRAHGLGELQWNGQLGDKAQAWAEHMARQGRISHSNLADGAPSGWRALGENVGVGGSIGAVHTAYMNSPGHRANIVNPRWTHVGTGVARSGGRVYTVQVFMQR